MREVGGYVRNSAAVVVVVVLLWWHGVAQVNSQRIPALFIFGDSMADVGNNNFLRTLSRANFYPYGIDYQRGPTGRFSNGRSFIDFVANLLGLPSPPAFADPTTTGRAIINGVNYASANGGILDESGRHYGERYGLSQQVLNFQSTLNQLRTMMDAEALKQYLAKSIAIVVIGNNDYINNYLLPGLYDSSSKYTSQQFANLLVNTHIRNMLALQSLGFRKLFLAGVGPIGCTPNQRARGLSPPGRCYDFANQMVATFNQGLRSMVEELNRNHPDSMFVYGNTYGIFGDMINHPAAYSFSVIDRACCGLGMYRGQITCLPYAMSCVTRNQYLYWDAFNPSQDAAYVYAWRVVNGPASDAYPINLQQMAQL
ncbi:hypothetical protein PIB30_046870 [Stylosanthes scabra]|uniref:Uncharacterized protein n=1 Tax=Stylosanthes scabra TaxID=79078 RepID=A0ABU6QG71_9FABA|nr:hypothetical protein [Stylosanthes scabra]